MTIRSWQACVSSLRSAASTGAGAAGAHASAREALLAACRDALEAAGAPQARDVRHVVLAGAGPLAGSAGLEAHALAASLGLRRDVGVTAAISAGGAALLGAIRIADACCRTSPRGAILCVALETLAEDAPAAGAALVAGLGLPQEGSALRIEHVATWTRLAGGPTMTWGTGADGFDLEGSSPAADARSPGGLHAILLAAGLPIEPSPGLDWAVHVGQRRDADLLADLERLLGGAGALEHARRALHADASPMAGQLRRHLARAAGGGDRRVIALGLGGVPGGADVVEMALLVPSAP